MNLVWFRKDLRLDDNPALCNALKAGHVTAIFIATPKQWQQHDMAPIQADFIERHLNRLSQQLLRIGITLNYLVADDYDHQQQVLLDYCQIHAIDTVFANSEPGFDENHRDSQLIEKGLNLQLTECDVVVPRGQLHTNSGNMYQVFTPFKRAWLDYMRQHELTVLDVDNQSNVDTRPNIGQLDLIKLPCAKQDSRQWPLADWVLYQQLADFMQYKVNDYHSNRDIPSIDGTSGLSPYLAIGAISVRRIVQLLLVHYPQLLNEPEHQAFSWLNELVWRDFYRHLMSHYPHLSRHRAFKPKFDQLMWPDNEAAFDAWCNGKTGYPIVDAAMLQLRQTGWMHNRLRMICASFLSKHLLIDWRRGERFFMQHLIDGDLSANNGGWQWAAGTGCDAQPWFRIFNPVRQSERFDPNGQFIRQFLPQLAGVPDKHIHFPHGYLAQHHQSDDYHGYWPAIVDHKSARDQALAFYNV